MSVTALHSTWLNSVFLIGGVGIEWTPTEAGFIISNLPSLEALAVIL